ncbi:EAL domain-containing protein [Methylomonas sp. SURF-2]|uniref:EAL domain-containing protein n=1 Tax=Methylomonas subterranea TaxID=2952225 RepID=A0ABT1TLC6_9GAMM|nr:EAL domain-containing protein [Methylomonas sp. SURF-2]MCQ8106285.1 EAL domain-containing protein [Methylomonas sp. SURF-2]
MAQLDRDTLRHQAEALLSDMPSALYAGQLEDVKALIHELSVHQVELEMQNQSLRETYQSLLQAKNNFSLLFEQAPAGYLKMDPQGRILKANQTLGDMLELSQRDIEGQHLNRFIHPEDAIIFSARYPAFFNKPDNKTIELRLLKNPRQSIPFQVQLNARRISEADERGQSRQCLLVTAVDVTDRHRLTEEKALAAEVFETSEEAILITNERKLILGVNQSFMDITDYQRSEVIGRSLICVLFAGHHFKLFELIWSKLVNRERWKGEIELFRRNGSAFTASLTVGGSHDSFGKIKNCILMFSDITQKKLNDRKIEFLAHYDILTQLPNRSYFNELLNNAILHASRSRESLSILFLDLDRFKLLNDTCGHLAGDVLLQNVAGRLLSCVRETDSVSRFAGDEFVVMLTHFKDFEQCRATTEHILQKLLNELSLPHEIGNIQFNASVSIGVALFPAHGTTAPELIKNADTAMYAAKAGGRNRYRFYSDQMRQQAIARSSMEFELQTADWENQFNLVYQPLVNLADCRIYGHEALLRWQHPQRGELKPDSFLAIAEDNGMINPIGDWVIRSACQQAAAWRERWPATPLKISINLSPRQFLLPNLRQTIQTLLTTHGLKGSQLILEITEYTAMQNIGESIRVMHELRELGILLGIDDFGTGYSSLAYLNKFPLNILKIDQSFIHELDVEKENVLIKSIIDIGRNMDLLILAEGIEKPEQAELLKHLGCQLGQGYFYAPPLPVTDIVPPF